MPDRLVVDLSSDGQAGVLAGVLAWPEGGLPEPVSAAKAPVAWPLDADALEDLRWYLEDYLLAPFGVWEERGPAVREKLAGWGEEVFGSVFGPGRARDAYQRARDRGLEVVFRSAEPGLLGLPWELMRDGAGPVAMGAGGISRSLPTADGAGTLEVPGGRLRVLMVISRPAGTKDVGYQMVARPLLERLDAVRGEVDLIVLRPPTFDTLAQTVKQAAEAGQPFHVVHFDGHGAMLGPPGEGNAGGGGASGTGSASGGAAGAVAAGGGPVIGGRPAMMSGPGEGVLAFEAPGGGSDLVGASKVAAALADGRVPVVVLNACQSGAVGKELEASVATALLKAGCAAVVAMAYSVYAVAAAEFMAAFYEALFAGDSVGQAVTAGRKRLFGHDGRPSPKGDMPLADWLVPVHYLRREVRFPDARTPRPAAAPSLDAALDRIRAAATATATAVARAAGAAGGEARAEAGAGAEAEAGASADSLAAVGGAFVGRDDLFYQLETAARLQRVVVLAGPGGTGKTELAKGFARWWRDTAGVDDPRLVRWHSFEPGVASFGLDGVITGIGLAVFGTDFARLDADERLTAVKQLLGQYRALLVWDNFESVREMPDPAGATPPLDNAECGLLREFLEWVRDHSASAVLITSRAPEGWLGPVRRIGVGGLNWAEAAQYAGHLLAPYPAAQRRRERPSFADLLEWLDGHPLSMRLTLPLLDTTDPAGLLAGLRGIIPLPGADIVEGRLASLGACVAYSFAHLPDQARRLLPALSLFHGTADVDVLAAFSTEETVPGRFAGAGVEEWSAALAGAARVGLLTDLGAGMYRIHPALPGYLAAAWQTDAPDRYDEERDASERALRAACADFSQWLTGQIAAGDATRAYALIGWQRRTLGAMLGHALDHQAWADASGIVRALDKYWDTRGLGGEAAAWAGRIIDATAGPGQAPAEAARPLWLYTTVRQAARQKDAGQPELAAQAYRRALAYLQAQPATEWTRANIAVTYHQLGMTAQARGRLDEPDDWYRQSLAIDEELGNTAYLRGRLDEADDWYRQSLTINEELGNRPGMANTYHQLGNTAYLRRRQDEADDWYRRSLAIEEELGDRPSLASTYQALGNTAYLRGRLDEADDWYRKALTINEELGNRPGMAITYQALGITAQNRRRLDEADDWYRKALAINEELGDRPGLALTYAQLGLLAEDRDQAQTALAWNVRCVSLFDQFPSPQTGTGPTALVRLTRQLGLPTLEETWQQLTGQPLPQAVRDYITGHDEQEPEGRLQPTDLVGGSCKQTQPDQRGF